MPLAGRRPAQRAVASAAALALALLGSRTGSPAGAQTFDIVGPVVTVPGGVPGGNAAACTAAGSWCGTLLGFGAGSQAALPIDGAGSELRSPLGLVAGNAQPMTLSSATTTARITVGNGGSLRTGSASIGAWGSWPGRSVAAATSPAAARVGSLRCRYPSLRHGR